MNRNDKRLIERSLDDPLSQAEQARLADVIAHSPEARAQLKALRELRAMLVEHADSGFAPGFTDRVMRRARQADEARSPAFLDRLPDVWPVWMRVSGALAIAVFVVALGVVLTSRPTHIEVDFGDVRLVLLPDGSRVELGSGSSLTYGRFWPGSERRVRFVGEAFFDVAPSEQSFVVETFNAAVHVRGTAFNVRAWPSDPEAETVVTVTEGAVEVQWLGESAAPESRASRAEVVAGQKAVLASGRPVSPMPLELPAARALAWRSGGLAFIDRSLGGTLNELERRFAVRIELADPALALERVTYLQPNPGSVTDVLADIAFSKQLQFRPIREGFELSRAQRTE